MRVDGRANNELRKVRITRNYIKHAEGSVLIEAGDTKVICNATVEERIPPFKKDTGEGWVTAEYSMLPRATQVRNQRDISKLRLGGRTQEIQRLIGRALRSVVDLKKLGERQIILDCDVIQADGGTRTASITGAYVALADACKTLTESKTIDEWPLTGYLAAVSVGIVNNESLLDLCYKEDSNAHVDMNIIMDGKGSFIEIQATGEQAPFSKKQFLEMISLAEEGIMKLVEIQKEALSNP